MSKSSIADMNPTFNSSTQNASPVRDASDNKVKLASLSTQPHASKKWTPLEVDMQWVNQVKSLITCLFKQIGAKGIFFPFSFAYDDWSAGLNKGYAFSPQLQYPRILCQSRNGCRFARLFRKFLIASIRSSCFPVDIEIGIDSRLTSSPIIISIQPNSCFHFSCGILTLSNSLSNLTCFTG